MASVQFGLQLWPQRTTWPEYRESALAAEAAGWDSIWTWDHLLAIQGPWDQPILDGWSLVTAAAAITRRVRVGMMVSANTFRNPALTAKMATTLDHISNARAVLGIGGAWFEREHEAFGIEFGATTGERLDRLEEAVPLMRRLLDGERFSHEGTFYRFVDATSAPAPVQEHLPIMVGGSGPTKTMRTVARHADGWNTGGDLASLTSRLDILARHCADAGRDMSEIELTTGFPMIIADTLKEAERRRADQLLHNGVSTPPAQPALLGPPEMIAETYRPYLELGFSTVIVRMPAPFDRETIHRLPELLALFN